MGENPPDLMSPRACYLMKTLSLLRAVVLKYDANVRCADFEGDY